MSGVPIVIVGTIKDNDSGDEKQVTITGLAGLSGYAPGHPLPGQPPGIWGGPIDPYPGHPLPEPPGKPPGIWGPGDNRPWNPISGIPGIPGYEPPKPGEDPPLIEWKVGWTPATGWIVVGIPQMPHPTPSKG